MTLGWVFGAFGELRPVDRFSLGCLLQADHRFVPVTAADFAALPIPTSHVTGVTFISGLHHALGYLDGALADWSLGSLVPGIIGSTEPIESAPSASNRLVAMVRTRGFRVWADLDRFTLADIRGWHGAGKRLANRLIIAAVECALRTAVTEQDHQLSLTFDPPPIRGAACQVLDRWVEGIADIRGRAAFEIDDVRLDKTGDQVVTHELVGVTPEYTRRLKNAARSHITSLAGSDPLVASTLQQLSQLLGQAVTTQGIETALTKAGLPALGDPAGALAVWLTGPHSPVSGFDGWWSPRPSELVATTRQLLAESGGVHTLPALLADVTNLGVADAHAVEWISVQDVRIVDGMVVSLAGRPSSVAIRALEATGRAMSAHELSSWLAPGAGLGAAITMLRRNSAFVETGSDHWELTDWGGQPVVQPVSVEVPVTAAVLAGDTGEAPPALASLLALVPGTERKLSTRFGPFVVSYDGSIVMRGSVRPVVLASGATLGDVLVFNVDPKQPSVSVTVWADPTSRLFDLVQLDPTSRSLL